LAYIPDRLGCLYGTLFSFSCAAERSNELDGWLRVQGRSRYRYMRGNCRQQLYRPTSGCSVVPAAVYASSTESILFFWLPPVPGRCGGGACVGCSSSWHGVHHRQYNTACVCLLVVSQLSAVCPLRVVRCLLCLSVVRSWIILRHVDSVFHCFPRCPVICVAGRQ